MTVSNYFCIVIADTYLDFLLLTDCHFNSKKIEYKDNNVIDRLPYVISFPHLKLETTKQKKTETQCVGN